MFRILSHFLELTFQFLPGILDPMSQNTSTINESLAEIKQASAQRLPAEVVATFSADQRALASAGLPAGLPATGTPMPDGMLQDVASQPTTLAEARDGKPAVVVFYRGGWCPYCNLTLRTYQAELVPALAEAGVGLIAITPEKPDGSLSLQETAELTFTILTDPGNQIAGQLGIAITPPAEVTAAQAALGLDLTQRNADGTTRIPMPAVAIVDAAGVIRWIDVHPDYTTRTDPAEVLRTVAATLS
jgi:peroxiredoxin